MEREEVTVILSVAKDLMPIANGDEVLRCAQDDRVFVEATVRDS
jgi:hypothetical protein